MNDEDQECGDTCGAGASTQATSNLAASRLTKPQALP
jgi:hypothetical protein